MAGKTFSGIGDFEKENPPLGPDDVASDGPDGEQEDVRGVYSGPTVVDDDKVAEGLKRLRSLEQPPAPAEGEVSELVADMDDSSEPTKIGMPMQRPTAVGRSLSADVPGQQMVVHPDSLRGTMFGHSVHRPELHEPIEAEEAPSGPIYVPPKQAAPTQLIPYHHRAQSFPGVEPYPMEAQPFHRGLGFPPDEVDVRTQTIPPLGKRMFARAAAVVVGVAVVAAGAFAYKLYGAAALGGAAPQAAGQVAAPADDPTPAPHQAMPAASVPAGGLPTPSETPAPAEATAPAEAPRTATAPGPAVEPSAPIARPSPSSDPPLADAPSARRRPVARGDEPVRRGEAARGAEASRGAETAATAPAGAYDDSTHLRRRPPHAERRHGAAEPATEAGPADEAPAPKPVPKKKGVADEDPDATLPPSSLE